MRISDWSSDVCSSDLLSPELAGIVDEISFKSGEDIKAGAVLVKLRAADDVARLAALRASAEKIGSASCRERVCAYVYISVVAVSFKNTKRIQLNEDIPI